jgi:hypothetical protein
VAYYEREATIAWKIGKDDTQQDVVLAYSCPKDKWINSLTKCSDPMPVVTVADFALTARAIALKWAAAHPDQDLKPLKGSDLTALLRTPNIADLITRREKLRVDLKDVEDMLAHFPSSPKYQQSKAELSGEIAKLDLTLAPIGGIETTIKNLTESVLKLIRENDATKNNEPYNFTHSQMENTFIDVVMQGLSSVATYKVKRIVKSSTCSLGTTGTIEFNGGSAKILSWGGNSGFGWTPVQIAGERINIMWSGSYGAIFIDVGSMTSSHGGVTCK